MSSQQSECRHEPCDCKAKPDSDFCSQACEQAHASGERECPCDHVGCQGHES